jgi:hypothetical protein
MSAITTITEERQVLADLLLAWSQHIEDGGRLTLAEFEQKLANTFRLEDAA